MQNKMVGELPILSKPLVPQAVAYCAEQPMLQEPRAITNARIDLRGREFERPPTAAGSPIVAAERRTANSSRDRYSSFFARAYGASL